MAKLASGLSAGSAWGVRARVRRALLERASGRKSGGVGVKFTSGLPGWARGGAAVLR